jgi:hypothetical protein
VDQSAAHRELCIRLYRWGMQEWQGELASDLPRLTTLTGVAAIQVIELLRSLDPQRRVQLAHAMAKRFHKEACGYLNDDLTPEALELLRWADSWRMQNAHRLVRGAPQEKGVRKLLIKELRQGLTFLGQPERLESAVWVYRTPVATWRVSTFVDAGGRFGDCSYNHWIETCDGVAISKFVSFLSVLGVSSETKWRVTGQDQVRGVADGMAGICRHFLAAAPSLLSGLTVDS